MKLLRSSASGTLDLTQLVSRAVWSGDKGSCSRTLEFELACVETDPYLPKAPVSLGDRVRFYDDDELFDGYVFTISKGTGDRTKTVRCFDRGVYLNRNQDFLRVQNTTPEALTALLCKKWDIPIGSVAATGFRFSRNFLGVGLYKMIATAYTLASAETGEKYHVGFEGSKLYVRKKQKDENTLIIRGGVNLISADVTESIEKLVNRVMIVDKNYNVVSTQQDAASIKSYGVVQEIVQQGDNALKQAKKTIADSGAEQKITVEDLGDVRSVTGRMVAVQERHSGLWGLFWIDSDTHTWQNGIYTNKLVLNLRNVMDEQEAGSLDSAGSGGSASSGSGSADKTKKSKAAKGKGVWYYYRE